MRWEKNAEMFSNEIKQRREILARIAAYKDISTDQYRHELKLRSRWNTLVFDVNLWNLPP